MSDERGGPSIGGALKAYLDKIFSRVPVRDKYKEEMQAELETHIEEHSEELLERGYKPYAAEAEIMRRIGEPEVVADKYNRMESLRSWFRDPLCVRALLWVAGGFVVFSVFAKIVVFVLGVSGFDMQMAYDLDRHFIDMKWISALFSGLLAYWLYFSWSGNIHRITPFTTLSIVLLIFTCVFECNLNFIAPLPNPECRVFLYLDLPSIHQIASSRLFFVYEFDVYGMSIGLLENVLHSLTPPYSSGAPLILFVHYVGLVIAAAFIFERIKQRRFFQEL